MNDRIALPEHTGAGTASFEGTVGSSRKTYCYSYVDSFSMPDTTYTQYSFPRTGSNQVKILSLNTRPCASIRNPQL